MRRVFDICHGCRRCFNLCASFPRLFDLVDNAGPGELDDVPSAAFKGVVDACTLCGLCFMSKCPYVPPHPWGVDFPHLMVRYRAAERAQGAGPSFAARQMAETGRNGALASLAAPLVNWVAKTGNGLTRPLLEKAAGIHRDAALPRFHGHTFVRRAAAEPVAVNTAAPAYGRRKAVLYATCSVNHSTPSIGLAARAVLAKLGVETAVAYPGCCAMPKLEQGDLAGVTAAAARVAQGLEPWIDRGYDVVALVPSCAVMLKTEWPLTVPADAPHRAAVDRLARATVDLSEYVVDIARREGLAEGLGPLPGGVALHIACHARVQNIGQKAAEMLRLIPQPDVTVIERCSGHGGAWGVKTENFPTALAVGRPVVKQAVKAGKRFLASECPLAGPHIAQGMQAAGAAKEGDADAVPDPLHPIELFARAYGIDVREG